MILNCWLQPVATSTILILNSELTIFSAILRKRLPILAKKGCLSFQLDHKHIHKRQGDNESKALGFVAVVASEDGSREVFTLGYLATDDATDNETIKLVKDCLEDYDLMDSFKKLEIINTFLICI